MSELGALTHEKEFPTLSTQRLGLSDLIALFTKLTELLVGISQL